MTQTSGARVRTEDRAGARIIALDNPPVNALSFAVANELCAAIAAAEADPKVQAIVLTGANGRFSAGADIAEFATEPPAGTKTAREAIALVERSAKTYVAAIEETALGGGFELALACDYRLATAGTTVGLPEITLGLIPGGGGTQRLPRLIGAQAALRMMLDAESVDASAAKRRGLLDEVVASDAVAAALALIARVASTAPKRRVSARRTELGTSGSSLFAAPWTVAQAHAQLPPDDRGGLAAHKLVDAVEAAIDLDFARGLAREARLAGELKRSASSAALCHLFFAERAVWMIPDMPPAHPLPVETVGIVGAGTMGTAVAITFANAGIPTIVVEPNDAQVQRSTQIMRETFAYNVRRERITADDADARRRSVRFASDHAALADVDLVVEAVFEDIDVKKAVFAKLDTICKPSALLASNTSSLDIDAMAAATNRPAKVLGLHFYTPANIQKLLEIVRCKATSPEAMASAVALGKRLEKVGVVSANAFGFIGNRMILDYAREAIYLGEEGVAPERVDRAMREFGMAMGPFAMFDLSGVDVFWLIQNADPNRMGRRSGIFDRLYQEKRFGQKAGVGMYRYEPGSRVPIPDPATRELFREEAAKAGIAQRTSVSDDEIRERLFAALVNVGAELLRTGVALRPGDIDIVYIYGYGFPRYLGGPMWHADRLGPKTILASIERFRASHGDVWIPSPLLVEIAGREGTFAAFSKELTHA